ncbi:uncharacterized protein K02A2.6-like [Toxorhynchites rutilus septentrionalis]|uniref:uncharacterized protein K02A2.6-like n=1 Tax=Toxorhynchites rutilus septentrionalis TaxID=329112 RepID=UPI00247A7B23|nr:uncharacterized protein K02A2.6-like [Toxorhynchites rutilus septentrionalis]
MAYEDKRVSSDMFRIEQFNDMVDTQNLRREWEEWHRAFELTAELRNVATQHDKFVLLLASGGRGLQRIFYNLRPSSDEFHPGPVKVPLVPVEVPEYDNAIKRLNKFFIGKRNERIELEVFRSIKQTTDETFNQFLLRLRGQAARCDFADRDREILLKQKGKSKPLEEDFSGTTSVAAVHQKWNKRQTYNDLNRSRYGAKMGIDCRRVVDRRNQMECTRCESFNHQAGSENCYARNARCNECGTLGHYARKCRNVGRIRRGENRYKRNRPNAEVNAVDRDDRWKKKMIKKTNEELNAKVETFVEADKRDNGTVLCLIDKYPVPFLIDSGSAIDAITEDVWDKLIDSNATLYKKRFLCDRTFTAYASQQPLQIRVMFEAWISVNYSKPSCYAEIFVIKGASRSLLSKTTAEYLKILKIGLDVNNINVLAEHFPKFPNVQVKLSIDKSVVPRKICYLKVPEALKEKVDAKILEMLRSDVIEPANGPAEWISPMVVVPKGKDDIRLCINMRHPNKAIQREHFPLPIIETFLNKLRGATYFSKLDITSAYHHVELHPDSRSITTFMTDRGLMRFKRLMFGRNCAPEIFQRIMTQMLTGIEGVIVYIDDIVVSGRNKREHDERLRQVMTVLDENNTKLNRNKCVFGVSELEIFGFKVSTAGIRPTEEKIAAIKNFRKPESREEVRSFLGLVNFVGHFIPHLSTRTEPLRQFVRGDVLIFGEEQVKAFNDLRLELTKNVRKLGYFDPADFTELYVDASPVGLDAVLVQRHKGIPRIISFASKGLTAAERIYPQTQREALAVVWAVEKFYLYLFGLHFTIFTDHKTLEFIYGNKHQEGRRALSRAEGWALRLQQFNFEMKHIAGHTNIFDSLSRLCCQSDVPFDDTYAEHYLWAVEEGLVAISLEEIQAETDQDEVLIAVKLALESGNWPPNLFRYQAFHKELGISNGIVIRDERIVLPTKLRTRALDIAHRGHPGIIAMRRNLREKVWWPCMDRDVTDRIEECAGCTAVRNQMPPEPMFRKEMSDRAWQQIAIDFFSAKECATFLIVVDYYSRFLQVGEMKSTTASRTIEALESIFLDHTYPETIRSDNSPPFSSIEFANYCSTKNIKLVRTIPYWPQMNGLVERTNQGILRALRIAKATNRDWRKAVKEHVYIYNTTPHSVTEKAPMELLTGRPVKDLLPSLRTDPAWNRDEGVRDSDAMKKIQGKIYADQRRNARTSDIKVGDIVMVRNFNNGKLEPMFKLEKCKVMHKSGNDTVVEGEEGVTLRRSVTHLRKWPKSSGASLPPHSPESLPVSSSSAT